MNSSLRAPFGASWQTPSRLPLNARIHQNARDWQVVDWLVSEKPLRLQRMIILFDQDRPELLVHDFLTATNHKSAQVRSNIVALAEAKGRVHLWYGCALSVDKARRALGEAAATAIWPTDRWQVDITLVPMKAGKLDRSRLDPSSPLLQAVPRRFELGLIEVRP